MNINVLSFSTLMMFRNKFRDIWKLDNKINLIYEKLRTKCTNLTNGVSSSISWQIIWVEIFWLKIFEVRFRTGGRVVVSNQQYFDDNGSFFFVDITKKSCKNFFVSSRSCSLVWDDDGSLLFIVDVGDGTINESDSISDITELLIIVFCL